MGGNNFTLQGYSRAMLYQTGFSEKYFRVQGYQVAFGWPLPLGFKTNFGVVPVYLNQFSMVKSHSD